MKNILITGATGFIGSYLLKNLYPQKKIFLILRGKSKKNEEFKKYKKIKIINYNKFNELNKKLKKLNIDVVIHCATHYVRDHKYNDILKLSKSNIIFGNIILENLEIMKAKKFINFSTVWEDYNSVKDNNNNLYSAYKKSFSILINYYSKVLSHMGFFNIMISDTFGENDSRLKIINVLKKNYKKNITTKIISKNLFINLLNIKDIAKAVDIIIKNNIKNGKYLIKNNTTYKIVDLINTFNLKFKKKLKVKWLSYKIIKEKIYPYKKLVGWSPRESSKIHIIDLIHKNK
jgi:nucleoside-diphosphate-sugar epimerase|tara:strand:+ start:141 stop:1007 length:867 start_codon:yes stop_codon:yes gene_type:complete